MMFPITAIKNSMILFIIPSPVHLISCMAVMSILYESSCDNLKTLDLTIGTASLVITSPRKLLNCCMETLKLGDK